MVLHRRLVLLNGSVRTTRSGCAQKRPRTFILAPTASNAATPR